jgi:hypothetical protein
LLAQTTNVTWSLEPVLRSNKFTVTNIVTQTTYHPETNITVATNIYITYQPRPVTNYYPVYRTFEDHLLQVVDFGDAEIPTLRRSVKLPAPLLGISHGGQILYTAGPNYDTNGTPSASSYLTAMAYDGVDLFLLGSVPIDTQSRQLILNNHVYVLKSVLLPSESQLQEWEVGSDGKLSMTGALSLPSAPLDLRHFASNALLASDGQKVFEIQLGAVAEIRGPILLPECLTQDFSKLRRTESGSLWLPLGEFGLFNASSP